MARPQHRRTSGRSRKQPGQTLVILAILIFVITAVIGLSVDVGRAHGRQRTNQTAANAAAVAGMNAYLQGASDTLISDELVLALEANQIHRPVVVPSDQTLARRADETYIRAVYLDNNGNWLGDVGSMPGGMAPGNTRFIRVTTEEPVSTSFARVAGRSTLTVSADSYATQCTPGSGIYPLTFDTKMLVGKGPGAVITISTHPSQGNIGSLDWLSNNNANGGLEASWTGIGNLHDGFREGSVQGNVGPKGQVNGEMEVGDWIAGSPGIGNSSGLRAQLDWHIANRTVLYLPLHDGNGTGQNVAGNGNNRQYKFSKLGRFMLLSHDLNGQGSLKLVYLSDGNGEACWTSGDVIEQPPDIYGHIDLNMVWREKSPPSSADVAIVFDISGSMLWNFTDTKTAKPGEARIDKAMAAVNSFIYNQLGMNTQVGADNRIAYVTFGQVVNQSPRTYGARMVQNWTKNESDFWDDVGKPGVPLKSSNDINRWPKPENYTATASGLQQAVNLLQNNWRTRDSNGRPVRHVVLLATDGMANVRLDGKINNQSVGCGDRNDNMVHENPVVQSQCPSADISPIGAAKNIARSAQGDGIEFYVVAASLINWTPQQLGLDVIAGDPSRVYNVRQSQDMTPALEAINRDLGLPCTPRVGPVQASKTAQVELYSATTNQLIATTSVNASGDYVFNAVAPGEYYIMARDTGATGQGVVNQAHNPPDATARLYTRMSVNGISEQRLITTVASEPLRQAQSTIELNVGDASGNEVAICQQ